MPTHSIAQAKRAWLAIPAKTRSSLQRDLEDDANWCADAQALAQAKALRAAVALLSAISAEVSKPKRAPVKRGRKD